MKIHKIMFLAGLILSAVMINSCYTVVAVKERPVRHTAADRYADDVVYDEFDEWDEDYYENDTAVERHYMYGDLWSGSIFFDSYWGSPLWYGYSHYNPYYYNPYHYSPFYGYNYSPWGYSYWGTGYYRGYYDPYWSYWSGYYSSSPQKRRTFDRRELRHRRDAAGSPSVITTSQRSSSLAKASSTDETDAAGRGSLRQRSTTADRSAATSAVTGTSTRIRNTDTGSRAAAVKQNSVTNRSAKVRSSSNRSSVTSQRVRSSSSSSRAVRSRSSGSAGSVSRRSSSSGSSSGSTRSSSGSSSSSSGRSSRTRKR